MKRHLQAAAMTAIVVAFIGYATFHPVVAVGLLVGVGIAILYAGCYSLVNKP